MLNAHSDELKKPLLEPKLSLEKNLSQVRISSREAMILAVMNATLAIE